MGEAIAAGIGLLFVLLIIMWLGPPLIAGLLSAFFTFIVAVSFLGFLTPMGKTDDSMFVAMLISGVLAIIVAIYAFQYTMDTSSFTL